MAGCLSGHGQGHPEEIAALEAAGGEAFFGEPALDGT